MVRGSTEDIEAAVGSPEKAPISEIGVAEIETGGGVLSKSADTARVACVLSCYSVILARPIPGGDWTLSLCVWLHRHFFSGLPCSTFSTPPASGTLKQPGETRRANVAPFSSHGTRRFWYI